MAKIDKLISDILKSYKVDPREACWDCHGTWVIYHRYLERIADKAGITFDTPEFVHTDVKAKEAVLLVTGHMGDKSAWSIGEATNYNNKNPYPFAMAEKRGKDRVILKLAGLSGHVYSEEEADDFKDRAPNPPPKQVEVVEKLSYSNPNVFNGPPPRGGPRPSPPTREPVEEVVLSLDERIKMLQECLTDHPGGIGRAIILKVTGFSLPQFNETISALREEGKVELRGQKRGAKWHWVADEGLRIREIPESEWEVQPVESIAPGISEHDLDIVMQKVINSGVGFINISNVVQELTGCQSAHQALTEGRLTQDILDRISELA